MQNLENDTDELICKAEIQTLTQRMDAWILRWEEEWNGVRTGLTYIYTTVCKILDN